MNLMFELDLPEETPKLTTNLKKSAEINAFVETSKRGFERWYHQLNDIYKTPLLNNLDSAKEIAEAGLTPHNHSFNNMLILKTAQRSIILQMQLAQPQYPSLALPLVTKSSAPANLHHIKLPQAVQKATGCVMLDEWLNQSLSKHLDYYGSSNILDFESIPTSVSVSLVPVGDDGKVRFIPSINTTPHEVYLILNWTSDGKSSVRLEKSSKQETSFIFPTTTKESNHWMASSTDKPFTINTVFIRLEKHKAIASFRSREGMSSSLLGIRKTDQEINFKPPKAPVRSSKEELIERQPSSDESSDLRKYTANIKEILFFKFFYVPIEIKETEKISIPQLQKYAEEIDQQLDHLMEQGEKEIYQPIPQTLPELKKCYLERLNAEDLAEKVRLVINQKNPILDLTGLLDLSRSPLFYLNQKLLLTLDAGNYEVPYCIKDLTLSKAFVYYPHIIMVDSQKSDSDLRFYEFDPDRHHYRLYMISMERPLLKEPIMISIEELKAHLNRIS